MENEELLYEPMEFFDPGTCPDCGGPIVVIDSDISVLKLRPNGVPYSVETLNRVKAACIKCGNKLNMMRWNGAYIPYSESSRILKIMEFNDKLKDRIGLQNDENNKNPLSLD